MKTIQIAVETDAIEKTIEQLDEDNMPILMIEDDRDGDSGGWIFTIGESNE